MTPSDKKLLKIIGIILLIIGAIFITLIIAIYFFFHPSPYRTLQEKMCKGLYEYSIEAVEDNVYLKFVSAEDKIIQYDVKFKDHDYDNYYTTLSSAEINSCHLIIQRAVDYLNSENNYVPMYHTIQYVFRVELGSAKSQYIRGIITKDQNTYKFTELQADQCCLLQDLSVMEEVQYIRHEGGVGDIQLLGSLTNLKELRIKSNSYKGKEDEMTKELKEILPMCDVIWENE